MIFYSHVNQLVWTQEKIFGAQSVDGDAAKEKFKILLLISHIICDILNFSLTYFEPQKGWSDGIWNNC